jgi:UDP-N-acetylglucosamine 2-epimerase (non-hydrolysing)
LRISVVLGTRPEITKMAPVIKELEKRKADFFILHTGQHYSYNLDRVFFNQLRLPEAKYNIEAGSGTHAVQTSRILVGVEEILLKENPDIVLVEGDTNSVLAGALVAAKLHIEVGHVEAGLRSYDRSMPEEINRILTDHCSDYLFAPTEQAKSNLLGEGVSEEKIYVTGNTIVDAVYQNRELSREQSNILKTLNLNSKEYFLVTVHRQENVDDYKRFASLLEGLDRIADSYGIPVVYPIHPHSKKNIEEFKLETPRLYLIEPADYFDFLQLESNARLILTDSGGVQEEACILGVPCVTLRDNTERPETVEVGANVVSGVLPEKILENVRMMLDNKKTWENPYGDGTAGKKIVDIIM